MLSPNRALTCSTYVPKLSSSGDGRNLVAIRMGGRLVNCPCVYILANRRGEALYVGVTSNLFGRISLHKQKPIPGFTKRYGVTRLVYYETHSLMADAIAREKLLKRRKAHPRHLRPPRINASSVPRFASYSGVP
jgi:putative endonuclease